MKKMTFVAALIMLGAGVAFASSLSVPWFVDTTNVNTKLPPVIKSVTALIYLHNNKDTDLTCTIKYYTQNGAYIGPAAPNNTFVIPLLSTIAFRPCADDPDGSIPGGYGSGQEGAAGRLVPNRPYNSIPPNDGKNNGSCLIIWSGGQGDCQGMLTQAQGIVQPDSPIVKVINWGTTLPPGV
jgi:hypothetical protein